MRESAKSVTKRRGRENRTANLTRNPYTPQNVGLEASHSYEDQALNVNRSAEFEDQGVYANAFDERRIETPKSLQSFAKQFKSS